ncbi:ClpP/crotonase [Cylindrobasidium torrendii FP15055 ss-10]|uniref:ClpP/crotonase n=1 Tax=Cylindrobasidium torrendii FP15055 ss-10 TaxID=1314674 RepID=A0A0D7BVE1_9AGAR|nr:ClpP/crotonase [Cylindrobasidium torrendii FP15055 ss-10]
MASTFSTNNLLVSEPIPYVYHVQLSKKPVNAFDLQFWTEYGQLFDRLSRRETDVRAIVLSSSIPKLFCGGIDLSSLSSAPTSGEADGARSGVALAQFIREFQSSIGAPARCPIPVIAAVHGLVLGLGIDIMCACDIRYSASNASFCIKETEVGLAADIGTLAFLPKVCGNLSLVREYAYSSLPFDAKTAERMGFISRTVEGGMEEVVGAALKLAEVIASRSPVAVNGTKQIISHAIDHSIRDNLEYTAVWNSVALQTNDMPIIFAAMKEKKKPEFRPMRKSTSKL